MGRTTMTEAGSVELRIEALGRQILDGVLDPDSEDQHRMRVDVGIVPCFEDERPLQGLGGYIDWRSCGMLSRLLRSGWCTGRVGEALLMPTPAGLPVQRLVLLGLGCSRELTPANAAARVNSVVDVAHRLRCRSVLFAMPGPLQEREVVEAMFSGLARALTDDVPASPRPDEDVDAELGPADVGSMPHRWWIVVEARHVARLQRLLGGPPRPAET